MGEPSDFLDDENWHGGYYELAIKLGPRNAEGSTDRVLDALATVWSQPSLDGCDRDRWTARDEQERVAPAPTDPEDPESFKGVATLPSGHRVVCATHVIREDGGYGNDWLDLCLPLGALARVDHRVGGYPFGDVLISRAWREPIDNWFVGIAQAVAARHPFQLAMIGHEVSGQDWTFSGGSSEDEGVTYLVAESTGLKVLAPRPWIDADDAAIDVMALDVENPGRAE